MMNETEQKVMNSAERVGEEVGGVPETVMQERCAGCAYRPGTEANRDPLTQTTAYLCLLASEPFRCHHGDGGSSEHLCRGWLDAWLTRREKDVPEWKQDAARAILATLDATKDAQADGEPYNEAAFFAALFNNLEAFGAPVSPDQRSPMEDR